MLRAGKLTKRATLQRFKEPTDHFTGGGEWVDVANLMISLTPLSGRELFAAQQVEAQTTHTVETHFRGDVTPKMRLRVLKPGVADPDPENDDHYRTFNIESVVNAREANRQLEMKVVEQFGSPVHYEEPADDEPEDGDG